MPAVDAAPVSMMPPPPVAPAVPLGEVEQLRAEVVRLRAALADAGPAHSADVIDLNDERVLQEVGIYNYHHPLENAELYRERLTDLQGRITAMVKAGDAIVASDMFTYNNSLAKGRMMTGDLSKLMLRAYNAEADNCVRALRAGNVQTAKKRLDKAVEFNRQARLDDGDASQPRLPQPPVRRTGADSRLLDEGPRGTRERREERERLREERRAEAELAAEKEKLAKERAHYLNALEALRANGDAQAIAEMEQRLGAVDEAIAQNDYRAANIRAGYVYVISNPGSFGKHMVKIGMTRRLEPMDRIRELGDASVPFPFEVHALFFADDAVAVENELHKAFSEERVNRVNERREFFFATPVQVRDVLTAKLGELLEFTENPESSQYLQSRKYWPGTAAATGSLSL